jgi:hypothetical protein
LNYVYRHRHAHGRGKAAADPAVLERLKKEAQKRELATAAAWGIKPAFQHLTPEQERLERIRQRLRTEILTTRERHKLERIEEMLTEKLEG